MDEPCAKSLKTWLGRGIDIMPKETPKDRFRKHPMSATATNIIDERGKARKDRQLE